MATEKSDPSFRGSGRQHVKAQRLLEAVQSGELKTIREWSEKLDVSYQHLTQDLTYLRKQGHMIYPMRGKTGKRGYGGELVDIMKDPEDIRDTVNRQNLHYLAPTIESVTRLIEKAVINYPELREPFQKILLDKVVRLTTSRKSIDGNH